MQNMGMSEPLQAIIKRLHRVPKTTINHLFRINSDLVIHKQVNTNDIISRRFGDIKCLSL